MKDKQKQALEKSIGDLEKKYGLKNCFFGGYEKSCDAMHFFSLVDIKGVDFKTMKVKEKLKNIEVIFSGINSTRTMLLEAYVLLHNRLKSLMESVEENKEGKK
jgi:hypothetical protein